MRARRLRVGLSHLVCGCVFVLLLSPEGRAQIPQTIAYQGRLNGPGGPISDTLTMTFTIYDKKTGSVPPLVPLWTETYPAVVVDEGHFSVELGSINPLAPALAFDVPYFLGITVGSDPEMTPRLAFTSAGYALNSVHAQNADHAGNSDHAGNADHAGNSDHAGNADHATNAQSADNAVHAQSCDLADVATLALTVANGSITAASLSSAMCSDGEVLRKTSSGWACNLAVGPAGPTGAQGLPGPVGPTGPPGPGSGDFQNTAIVTRGFRDGSPVTGPGRYTDPVAAMADVPTWCGVPADGHRCLLKILPGTYDIGAAALVLQPFVTVAGSGESATTVRGIGGVRPSSTFRAVVFGADDAELRSVTIEAASPAQAAIANDQSATAAGATAVYRDVGVIARQIPMAIFNRQSNPVFEDVAIVSDTLGMRNDSATPLLTDVTITVTGAAAAAQGIDSHTSGDIAPGTPTGGAPVDAARVQMTNGAIRVSGGPNSAGVVSDNSHIELTNVRVEVSGSGQLRGATGSQSRITMTDTAMRVEGGANSEGIVATDAYVTISQSGITVPHGKAAVDVSGTQGFLVVGHSALVGVGGGAILKAAGAAVPALLAQTKLVGTVSPGLTCANVYDGVTYQPVVCAP